MAQPENRSEVARMRQSIEEEYESAYRGLHGTAIISRHDFIQKRMEGVAQHNTKLAELVGEQAAIEAVIEINDAAVSKYQAARDQEMQEDLMSRALWKSAMLNYQATGLELVALSFAMHHYFRCVEHSPTASKEEREMALHLRQFFDRLMTQLPPGNIQ